MRTLGFMFIASIALAQTPADPGRQAYQFKNRPTAVAMQEIATTLRTVLDVRELAIDYTAGTITIGGPPGDYTVAAWLMREFDRTKPGEAAQMPMLSGRDEVVRVYYLQNPNGNQGLQEIITTLRTVTHTQKIYHYSGLWAIALRGSAADVEMNTRLIQQLDKPAAGSFPHIAQQDEPVPGGSGDLVRVVYLPQATKREAANQILTAIRTTGQINEAYYVTAPKALTMRGSASRIALSQRLIDGWEKP